MRQNYMREQYGLTPTELVGYELSPLRNRATKTGVRSQPRIQNMKPSENPPSAQKKKRSILSQQFQSGANTNSINLTQNTVIKSLKTIPSERNIEGEDLVEKQVKMQVLGQNPQMIKVEKQAGELKNISQQITPQIIRSSSTGSFKGSSQKLKTSSNIQYARQDSLGASQLQQFQYQQLQQQLSSQIIPQTQSLQMTSKKEASKAEWVKQNRREEDEELEFNIWDNELLQIRGIDCEKWTMSDGKPFTLFHLYKARFGTFPNQRESIQNQEIVAMMKRFSRNRRNKNLERFPWDTFDDQRAYNDESDLFMDKNFIAFSKYFSGFNEIRINRMKIRVDQPKQQLPQQDVQIKNGNQVQEPQIQEKKPSFFMKRSSRSMSSQVNEVSIITTQQQQQQQQQQYQQLLLQQNPQNNNSQFRIRQLSSSSHEKQAESNSPVKHSDLNAVYFSQQFISNPASHFKSNQNPYSPSKRAITQISQNPAHTTAVQIPILSSSHSPVKSISKQLQKSQDPQSFSSMMENYSYPSANFQHFQDNGTSSPILIQQPQYEIQYDTSIPSPSQIQHHSQKQQNSFQLQYQQQQQQLYQQQQQQQSIPSFKLQLIQAMRNAGQEEEKQKREQNDDEQTTLSQKKSNKQALFVQQMLQQQQIGITSSQSQQLKKSSNYPSSNTKRSLKSPLKTRSSQQVNGKNVNVNTSITQSGGDQNGNSPLPNQNGNNKYQTNQNVQNGNILHLKNLHSQFHSPSPFHNELSNTKKINILTLLKQ